MCDVQFGWLTSADSCVEDQNIKLLHLNPLTHGDSYSRTEASPERTWSLRWIPSFTLNPKGRLYGQRFNKSGCDFAPRAAPPPTSNMPTLCPSSTGILHPGMSGWGQSSFQTSLLLVPILLLERHTTPHLPSSPIPTSCHSHPCGSC